jgi:hypothetical protein
MSNQTHVKTGEVRFSFCHLFEPSSFNDQKPKYSLSILIDKSDKATLAAIKKAYEAAKQVGVERYGKAFASKASPLIRPVGSNYGLLKDADQDDELAADPNYANHFVMNLKSDKAPQVLARETGRKRLTKEDGGEDIVYSGCFGKVTFNVYPYQNVATGISAGLNNVLKTRDGDRFGGWVSAEDDFADDLQDDDIYSDLL